MRERSRKCDSPQAKHGGLDCFYPHSIQEKGFTVYINRVRECNPDPCKGLQPASFAMTFSIEIICPSQNYIIAITNLYLFYLPF